MLYVICCMLCVICYMLYTIVLYYTILNYILPLQSPQAGLTSEPQRWDLGKPGFSSFKGDIEIDHIGLL